ncbi:MAG: glycosyltransferase family 4 protein [Algibacter sp.]
MHICFITSEYPKKGFAHGGLGSFVATLSKNLIKQGVKVSVVGINYINNTEFSIENGINIYRLKQKKIKGLTWLLNTRSINKKIKELHSEEPIDIIESAELGLAFLNKIKRVNYVIRLHGGHHFFSEAENRKINWWKSFQEKKSFKKADGFIGVSNYVKKHTASYLSYNNKPVVVIPSPVDMDVFMPKPKIEAKQNSLLFAGTVCEKKGISYLLKALPKVTEKFPDVKLNVYGRDWKFPNGDSYIDYLKNNILKNFPNWEKYVFFHGVIPYELLALKYAESEVCVFPSLMETQGLVAPEAMAMNKLVVFSKCGPGSETIKHKSTGLLCNPYDVDDISEQIIWALSHKKDSESIAEKGRLFVLNNFDEKTVTKRNIDFYNHIINN